MMQLTSNLADFYSQNSDFDNFALGTQKYGRFVNDKLEYMNDDHSRLFHPYSHGRQYPIEILQKQISIINTLTSQGMKVVTLAMKQHWRMAIGLGNASVYNNGFTFHPIYGTPYIPGQNVKGILRNYIIKEHFNKQVALAEKDPVFCHYFGCSENSFDNTARAGKLMFMDAFPTNSRRNPFSVLPDIMNPHYKEYYEDAGSSKAPHDALSPVPIIFLTLKKAKFQFNFYLKETENISLTEFIFKPAPVNIDGVRVAVEETFYCAYDNANTFFNVDEPIHSLIERTLIEALEIKGIGAKTRVGYGRFTVSNNI